MRLIRTGQNATTASQRLRDIDAAEYILRNHPVAAVSSPVISSRLQGVGAVLFSHFGGKSLKPDGLSSHVFCFKCSGARARRTDKPRRAAGSVGLPGMSLFLAADELSEWENNGPSQVACVFLGSEFLAALAAEAFDVDGETVQYKDAAFGHDEEGALLGKMIEQRLRSARRLAALEVDGLAQLIGLHALRHYSDISRPPVTLARKLTQGQLDTVVEYIRAHLSSPLRLADIAASIGMSQFAFSRAFRSSMGTTPHQYLTRLRIEHAKGLLVSGTSPICDIAGAVGFVDQSHLSAQFRRAVGTTPARYRRTHQA